MKSVRAALHRDDALVARDRSAAAHTALIEVVEAEIEACRVSGRRAQPVMLCAH